MATATRPTRAPARLAVVALVALLAAACSGTSAAPTITGAWARTSPMVAGAGALYLVIDNPGTAADALVGGSSPVARAVEVHETVDMSSAMPAASDGMGAGGPVLGMQKIDRLEIPAGGQVELKPGSYHVMLIDLARELTAGETIEVTLRFEKAGEVKVSAEVRAN